MGFSMREYRIMLSDKKRTLSFKRAILRTVRAGDRVLDIGAGTGILSFFAASAGAERVYAIDQTAIVPDAEKAAARNGFSGRIRFFRGHSLDTRLPEKCDVLVTETMGALGFDENILGSVIDAKRRFLKNGARIIPSRISLFAVPAALPSVDRQTGFWNGKRYGYDFSQYKTHAINALYDVRITRKHMLSPPSRMLSLELKRVEGAKQQAHCAFRVGRKGSLTGLVGWFEAELTPGIILNNGPGQTPLHWTQTCFPLENPLPVAQGDEIRFDLEFVSVGKHCFWSWTVRVRRKTGAKRSTVFSEGSTLQEYILDVLRRKPEAVAPASLPAQKGAKRAQTQTHELGGTPDV